MITLAETATYDDHDDGDDHDDYDDHDDNDDHDNLHSKEWRAGG